jgi:Ni/Co efflux regulator RcnB
MRKLLISAATLALLAVPALAQPEAPGSRGKAMMGTPQPAPQAAPAPAAAPPAAAPQNRGGGDRGGDRGARGGDRGNRGAAPVAQPAPQAAPAAQPQTRGNGFGGNRDGRGNQNADRNDRGNNRGDWRGNDNRPGNNGFGNRPGNNGFGNRPGYGGSRHDFSSFRDFHRDYRAQRRFRAPNYRRPSGWYDHRWSFGELLPSLFWSQQYWLTNYDDYDLPPPPYGAVWVREGSDALLIDRDSGEIISVAYDVFY